MSKRYFTIGMAGHIDHGKTTLTKALTNVDTDRLKEEKERQISIELGFAPLYEDQELQISVVDVPGHERFIRQMIAGVAGIDLVVLVVAADEGVMPQTHEHLQILELLGVKNGIIAITKINRVEEEFIDLVKDDILEELKGTVFENAPFMLVDSITKQGICDLKNMIINDLKKLGQRDIRGAFRLPIDQVFTVRGQGTVVRGTVFEGTVEEGQALMIMPKGLETRARQLQVHHKPAKHAFAGQRTAINLAGITKEELQRGDVLVSSEQFIVSDTIDVALQVVSDLDYIVKQRMPIKCHIGTAEVMGRIVFFDRNEVKDEEREILCQIRLEEEIVTKRGDRFIIRRPSPQETIGGGWVIEPKGEKYRFGNNTVEELERKKEGTPTERILAVLKEAKSLSKQELLKRASITGAELETCEHNNEIYFYGGKEFTLFSIYETINQEIDERLQDFHNKYPLKQGMNKAELIQLISKGYPRKLAEFVLEQGIDESDFGKIDQFIFGKGFSPYIPKNWQKRVENMLIDMSRDGYKVKYLNDYLSKAGIPNDMVTDLKRFLEETHEIISLDAQFYWCIDHFTAAVERVKSETSLEFEIGEAKDILNLSRKYMIPFLERLDELGYTKRVENKRLWQPIVK
ncbi:selenocysteine-specific translation elongation factor [Cytobacillus depressus]|uniref:Selenocysteine-specific elongation factor n=1 Tax=Cytobacillus depressus TaxID=1602942 RepID=A0A6L3VA36_9BACI|nr:selenocysteine-specific translation elongation factor [Cytobacillus depressus]KAB2337685.1 selenocysteine-specific translation elongation factor [Cytobacillus depressus]